MSIEFSEDKELTSTVERMIGEFAEFSAIRENEVKVLCAMKVNIDDKTEEAKPCTGAAVTLKKLGGAERVYMKDHAHYLLLMDWTTWNGANENDRERAIHPVLKKIWAGKDKNNKLKLSTNPPDVMTYYDTARRYGNTMEELANVQACLAHSRKVVQMVKDIEAKENAAEARPAPKAKIKPKPEPEPEPEPEEDSAPAPVDDAPPEPEEEAPLVEEEVLAPPPRVNKRASK